MTARKPPILMRGGLTGRIYIVTAYTEKPGGVFIASTKYDVTEQFEAIENARTRELEQQ